MKKVALSAAVCAMAFSANADVETSAFNSIYGGLGIGGNFVKADMPYKDKDAKDHDKVKTNRVMGSLVLGGGKVFSNNVYAGGEFLVDFAKSKKTELFDKTKTHGADVTVRGFVPQINAKAGYVFKNDILAYGKLGCAWSKVSVYDVNANKSYSKSKPSFVLGAGVEKAFCKKFSAAMEVEHNFGFKWQNKEVTGDKKLSFNKGWNVRALVKYNVKY